MIASRHESEEQKNLNSTQCPRARSRAGCDRARFAKLVLASFSIILLWLGGGGSDEIHCSLASQECLKSKLLGRFLDDCLLVKRNYYWHRHTCFHNVEQISLSTPKCLASSSRSWNSNSSLYQCTHPIGTVQNNVTLSCQFVATICEYSSPPAMTARRTQIITNIMIHSWGWGEEREREREPRRERERASESKRETETERDRERERAQCYFCLSS